MFLGSGIKANKKAFGRSDLECFLANACSNCAGPRQQFAKCRFNLMFAFLGRGNARSSVVLRANLLGLHK